MRGSRRRVHVQFSVYELIPLAPLALGYGVEIGDGECPWQRHLGLLLPTLPAAALALNAGQAQGRAQQNIRARFQVFRS